MTPGEEKGGVGVDMKPEQERIFREIYEENDKRLYQYIIRQIGDPSYTEDILQEVAVAFLFHFHDFLPGYPDNAGQIRAWLFKVAGNKIQHFWRRYYRKLGMETSIELFPNLETGRNEIADTELDLPLWLGPEERKLLSLRLKGYNLKEIADELGISHSTCRMRSSRLTAKLKKYLEK